MRIVLKHLFYMVYFPVSFLWRKLDKIASLKETNWWIDHIPNEIFTSETYLSYACWIQNQTFFSVLMSVYLDKEKPNIVDFGCGFGNVAPVAAHFVKNGGKFLGIDTYDKAIASCRKTYKDLKNCEFYLTRDYNAWYPKEGSQPTKVDEIDWPVENNSQDLVTAMSVFTHLQEEDAVKYIKKIHDVLAPGGLAFLSFAIIRDYVNPNHFMYNFPHPLTPGWYTAAPKCPELSIGIKFEALERLIANKFVIVRHIEGCLTGGKHPSMQDMFVFRKI